MRYGEVPGVEKRVSRLVQGTVPVGTKKLDESFAILDAVVAQGGNTLDTAHVYGNGDNERAFGQWIKERGNREEIVRNIGQFIAELASGLESSKLAV